LFAKLGSKNGVEIKNYFKREVIAKFQKAQDFFSEAEDKKEALLCKIM